MLNLLIDSDLNLHFHIWGGFQGSQKQPLQKTVFGRIETLLKELLNNRYAVFLAGRTDAGVHASEMVFHADFDFDFSVERIQRAFLRHLSSEGYSFTIN